MDDAPQPRGKGLLIALSVLPLIAALALVGWYFLPTLTEQDANTSPQVPDLGGRGKPLANAATPASGQADADSPVSPEDAAASDEQPDSTEREIDILIGALAHATKAGNRRGRELAHSELAKCKPSELVNSRLTAALEGELNAWVRMEFFKAYHDDESRRQWAMHVYDTRTSQFLGTTDFYTGGEPEEILLHVATLLPGLFETRDERLMALVRNAIDTEKPQWLLKPLFTGMLSLHREAHPPDTFATDRESVLGSLSDNLRRLLERQTAPEDVRPTALWLWLTSLPDWSSALTDIEQTVLRAYLPVLVQAFPPRSGAEVVGDWAGANAEKISELCRRALTQPFEPGLIRALIHVLSEHELPGRGEMLEAGLARKDEFYGDWLTALGRMAQSDAELQRLTSAADDPDVKVAQGAIEGLRASSMPGADSELKRVLEQGANLGVKSQALGALLDRAGNSDQLLEEYLDEGKEASLRAVAIAFVPIKNVDRLKKAGEQDASPRVRQAALTRLGELKDTNLLFYFYVRAKNDTSPVLRKQAERYAEELEAIKAAEREKQR